MQNKRLTINLDNIASNLRYFKSLTPQKMIFVAKSNCYGHGLKPVAKKVKDIVDWYAVIDISDGIALRKLGIDKPILLMASPTKNEIKKTHPSKRRMWALSFIYRFSLIRNSD